jgi:hypothetical protein
MLLFLHHILANPSGTAFTNPTEELMGKFALAYERAPGRAASLYNLMVMTQNLHQGFPFLGQVPSMGQQPKATNFATPQQIRNFSRDLDKRNVQEEARSKQLVANVPKVKHQTRTLRLF